METVIMLLVFCWLLLKLKMCGIAALTFVWGHRHPLSLLKAGHGTTVTNVFFHFIEECRSNILSLFTKLF
jgi:metallophosphoesterase superfamily enzyme